MGGASAPAHAARRLLREFGSFGAVVAGAATRLHRCLPADARAVSAIGWFRAAMIQALRPPPGERICLSDWRALDRYLQADMGFLTVERLRALFLDARNGLLADEIVGDGAAHAVALGLRLILPRALELGASGLILVHNHPSGDVAPSAADVASTVQAQALLRAVDIELHDHLVVGAGRITSMRAVGALQP